MTSTSVNKQTPAYPPAVLITDTVVWIKDIDWSDVRARVRGGINNCGLVLAIVGDKIHSLGCYLGEL